MALVFQARRTAIVALLTVNVAAGSAVAPEHLHERDDHHPSATVHRHFAPHHARRSADRARLDDDDDHVIWLSTAWLQAPVYHGPNLVSTTTIWFDGVRPHLAWTALVLDDAAPPHGPPRALCPSRAPPVLA
ncbi:MAG TPA: hypothetical protein VKE51_15685 [Vicinamibacterales bacterium]|nr:hypothetical protein [Vicinamibacterales bacterium]